VTVEQPNQVWATEYHLYPDGARLRLSHRFIDWFTRRVLSHRVSITMEAGTMEAGLGVEALQGAIGKYGRPEVFNSDHGCQFSSGAFTGVLEMNGIAISMDGKGAWRDNVFVERLWRSVRYEEV
jgi:putative transposase